MNDVSTKKLIVSSLLEVLRKEHEVYERIAEQARKDAIDSEMKQESKYDTRAIEAGYLAGAQKRRFEEIKIEIQSLEALELKDYSGSPAALGALVLLAEEEDRAHKHSTPWYFLAPSAGSGPLTIDGKNIKILSIHSPLARNLIGLEEGESFVLDSPSGQKEYSIEKIL